MRNYLLVLFGVICINTQAQTTVVKKMIVQTACGECQFHMKGKGCQLAVRINNKTYFVDGTDIDDHGDAHSSEGFCNAVREAEVTGEIINNRFVATSFKLVPPRAKKKISHSL